MGLASYSYDTIVCKCCEALVLGRVPRVRNLPQNFLEVVQELDKVGQAFDVFPERVRLSGSVALPTELDGPHERCGSLQKALRKNKNKKHSMKRYCANVFWISNDIKVECML